MSGSKRRYERVQPELQRDIVEDYQCGVRGHGYIAIARKHGGFLWEQCETWLYRENGQEAVSSPRRVGTKKQKLNSGDQTKLWRALDQNPFATNRELRGVVENKISECSVSRYLARAKPCLQRRWFKIKEPEELSGRRQRGGG